MWSTSCLPLLLLSISPVKASLHSRLQHSGGHPQQHITQPYLPLPLCWVIATMHLLVQLIKWVFLIVSQKYHLFTQPETEGRERAIKGRDGAKRWKKYMCLCSAECLLVEKGVCLSCKHCVAAVRWNIHYPLSHFRNQENSTLCFKNRSYVAKWLI